MLLPNFLSRFDRGVVVPLSLTLEFDCIEHLDVAHKAGHDQPALLSVKEAGDLRLGGLLFVKELAFKAIVLVKLKNHEHVVVHLVLVQLC